MLGKLFKKDRPFNVYEFKGVEKCKVNADEINYTKLTTHFKDFEAMYNFVQSIEIPDGSTYGIVPLVTHQEPINIFIDDFFDDKIHHLPSLFEKLDNLYNIDFYYKNDASNIKMKMFVNKLHPVLLEIKSLLQLLKTLL